MAPTRHPIRPVIYVLACIPSIDCVLNQINNATHATIASLSLLQAVRSPIVLILAAACLWRALSRRSSVSILSCYAVPTLLLIVMFVMKELLDTNTIAMPSVVAYGQLFYWVLLWTYVRLECRTPREAEALLYGIAAGSLLSAVSIFLGFCVGGLNPYADDGVVAGQGWFDTAKMITGVLDTGTVILLYLGRNRKSYSYQIAALFCAAACVLTYARAGQVALGLLIVWLAVWCLMRPSSTRATTATRFLAIVALVALVGLPALLHSQSFTNRWEDIGDTENGGSGRAAFWRVALEDYQKAEMPEVLLGNGFNGMSEMLYRDYGTDIRHTHNDCFDMMMCGGVCGIAWWAGLIITLARTASRQLWSAEGMATIGILLTFVCHGQLTGQLWGTDAMVAYTLGIASLSVMKKFLPSASTQPSDKPFTLPADSLVATY